MLATFSLSASRVEKLLSKVCVRLSEMSKCRLKRLAQVGYDFSKTKRQIFESEFVYFLSYKKFLIKLRTYLLLPGDATASFSGQNSSLTFARGWCTSLSFSLQKLSENFRRKCIFLESTNKSTIKRSTPLDIEISCCVSTHAQRWIVVNKTA